MKTHVISYLKHFEHASLGIITMEDLPPFGTGVGVVPLTDKTSFSQSVNRIRCQGFARANCLAEALCEASKMFSKSSIDIMEVMVVSNSTPHKLQCSRCTKGLNVFEHARKLGEEGVVIHVLMPRFIPELDLVYNEVNKNRFVAAKHSQFHQVDNLYILSPKIMAEAKEETEVTV